MLHYDTEYPYQSHLGRAASFGSVAVGVGGGVQQLQRRVVQGLSWFLAGFGTGRRDLGEHYLCLVKEGDWSEFVVSVVLH